VMLEIDRQKASEVIPYASESRKRAAEEVKRILEVRREQKRSGNGQTGKIKG
jgi:hypothetical protein